MKRKFISIVLIITALTTVLPSKGVLASNLTTTTIPYVEDNDVDAVNIVDLAKAMHVEVKKVNGGIEMFLNNKKVQIYDNDATIYINGISVPYKTTKMKNFETGEYYDMAIYQKPTKSGDGYLIPKTVIEDYIGIKCDSDGIHVDTSIVNTNGKTADKSNSSLSNGEIEAVIKVTNPSSNADNTKGRSTTGLQYKIDNNCETVNVEELAKAIGEQVTQTGDGIEVYLNGRKVNVVNSTGCAYVDGTLVYNKAAKNSNSTSGKYIDGRFVYDKATKNSGVYLLPKGVVQDKLGILCDLNDVIIKREVDSEGNVKVTSVSSEQPSTSTNGDKYEPYYDYDLTDYIDNYIDKHNISRITHDANLVNMLNQQMKSERQTNINEGWHTKGGKFYFLKKGVPITGWYKDVTTWYYFDKDGVMQAGWFKNTDGKWYYLYDSGAMAQKVCVNGYYLNENGAMANDVPANAPTGISYQELMNRARSLGYSHKTRYDAYSAGTKNYAAGYELQWYSKKYIDPVGALVIRDDNTCHISADGNSDEPNFEKAVNRILIWLLPTQAQEVCNKINAKPGQKQTLYADGRIIDVSFYQGGINFDIRDQ